MENGAACPIDHIKVSETRIRLTALWVCIFSIAFLVTGFVWVPCLLTVDFLFRSLGWGQYSPFSRLSGWIEQALSLKTRPVDRAPKIFAAQVGLLFSAGLLLASVFHYRMTAEALAGILVLFSFLESAFAFCAGCQVYTLWKTFRP